MEVVAKRDNVDDGDQSMKIKLVMPDHVDPVDWNCYENITDITVWSTCSFLTMFLLKYPACVENTQNYNFYVYAFISIISQISFTAG